MSLVFLLEACFVSLYLLCMCLRLGKLLHDNTQEQAAAKNWYHLAIREAWSLWYVVEAVFTPIPQLHSKFEAQVACMLVTSRNLIIIALSIQDW